MRQIKTRTSSPRPKKKTEPQQTVCALVEQKATQRPEVEVRVVLYSGGALSWAAAMRTIERYGTADLRLLFTDTAMEDADLYRFLDDSERQLGVPLVRVREGRTPWEIFRHRRFIGNTRHDTCSEMLKRKPGQKWIRENAASATLVFGIDWTEIHRLHALSKRYGAMGHTVEAPMCDAPWIGKSDVLAWMRREGLEPPRLYARGFAHNNCGGFCVRAGQGHYAHLLREMPERYAHHEAQEEALRKYLGKDVAILRDRRGGRTRPMTLRKFRERVQSGGQHDELEIGGCGCFSET